MDFPESLRAKLALVDPGCHCSRQPYSIFLLVFQRVVPSGNGIPGHTRFRGTGIFLPQGTFDQGFTPLFYAAGKPNEGRLGRRGRRDLLPPKRFLSFRVDHDETQSEEIVFCVHERCGPRFGDGLAGKLGERCFRRIGRKLGEVLGKIW